MKVLKLKIKQEFETNFGSKHSEAVLIVSAVNNNIVEKKLDILFQVYNSENDLDKQPIDFGFMLSFNEKDNEETIVNPNTGEVIKWGKPNYTEVLNYFDIVDEGIVFTNEQVAVWFLNKLEFQNKKLAEQWEIY